MKPMLRIKYLSVVLLLGPSIYVSPMKAGAAVPNDQAQGILIAQGRQRRTFFIPSGIGIPNRRIAGASRGETCLVGKKLLTALVPDKTVLTTSEYPTLFFYVPQNNAQALEIVVQLVQDPTQNSTGNDEQFYKATLKPTKQSGIVSVTMPPLAMDKTYKWTFSVICDLQNRDADKVVDGSLQRIAGSSTLKSQLNQAKNPQERVAAYAQNGIWINSLTTLADLRSKHPADPELDADWEDLLGSVGLQGIVQEPVLPCCKAQN